MKRSFQRKLCALLSCALLLTPQAGALSAGGNPTYSSTGPCGENLTYAIEDGTLRIQGTGEMFNYGSDDGNGEIPWSPYGFTVERVVVESGVTSIGSWAFYAPHTSSIASVQLPDTLKRIGECAFSGCNSLTELVLPEGLTVIGDGAFGDCVFLTELTIPDSVTSSASFLNFATIGDYIYTAPSFNQDTPSSWAKEEYWEAACQGLVTKRTCQGFRQDITRIQIAELAVTMAERAIDRMLTRALPENTPIGAEIFQQVAIAPSLGPVFQDTGDVMVRKAHSAGIIGGRSEGVFAPDETATREEIAAILCRTAAYIQEHTQGYAGLNMTADIPPQYTDASEVSAWAASSVAALTDAGILAGTSASELSPQKNASVEEAILLILRLYQQILEG